MRMKRRQRQCGDRLYALQTLTVIKVDEKCEMLCHKPLNWIINHYSFRRRIAGARHHIAWVFRLKIQVEIELGNWKKNRGKCSISQNQLIPHGEHRQITPSFACIQNGRKNKSLANEEKEKKIWIWFVAREYEARNVGKQKWISEQNANNKQLILHSVLSSCRAAVTLHTIYYIVEAE